MHIAAPMSSTLQMLIIQQLHVLCLLEEVFVAFEFIEAPKITSVSLENDSKYEVVFVVVFCFGIGQIDHHVVVLFLLDLEKVRLIKMNIAKGNQHIIPFKLLIKQAKHFWLLRI